MSKITNWNAAKKFMTITVKKNMIFKHPIFEILCFTKVQNKSFQFSFYSRISLFF